MNNFKLQQRATSRCPTHLVHFSKRTVAQLANDLPYVVRVDVPMDVLVLFDFLFDFQSGQTEYFTESSQCHR